MILILNWNLEIYFIPKIISPDDNNIRTNTHSISAIPIISCLFLNKRQNIGIVIRADYHDNNNKLSNGKQVSPI
jgi:hypothetical protein